MRKNLVHIVSIIIIFAMTLSVVGVNINIHQCGKSGEKSISLFSHSSDNCTCHSEASESCCTEIIEKSCCDSSENSPSHSCELDSTVKCCSDFEEVVSTDFDFVLSDKLDFVKINTLEYIIPHKEFEQLAEKIKSKIKSNKNKIRQYPAKILLRFFSSKLKMSDDNDSHIL